MTLQTVNKKIVVPSSEEDLAFLNSEEAQKSFNLMWDTVRKNGKKADRTGDTFLQYNDGDAYWTWFDSRGKFHYEASSWRMRKTGGRGYYAPAEIRARLKYKKK